MTAECADAQYFAYMTTRTGSPAQTVRGGVCSHITGLVKYAIAN